MLIVAAKDWAAEVLKELGAYTVDREGTWEEVFTVHKFYKKNPEALIAVTAAGMALEMERAVLYTGGTIMAGLHAARWGHVFNAGVYMAKKLGAAVLTIDKHFPWGTWELHLEHKFPLYIIYGGPDGPTVRYIRRRSGEALPLPLPPGAGHGSFWALTSVVLEMGDPLVVQLGFDIHKDGVAGYFFVDDHFYYRLGRALAGRRFYITLECPTERRLFRKAVASLLDGINGVERAFERPQREGGEVAREVERLLKSARLFRSHKSRHRTPHH
ncbi:MAG: histone deacetylase family protein [Pyrobaculum sp.]